MSAWIFREHEVENRNIHQFCGSFMSSLQFFHFFFHSTIIRMAKTIFEATAWAALAHQTDFNTWEEEGF